MVRGDHAQRVVNVVIRGADAARFSRALGVVASVASECLRLAEEDAGEGTVYAPAVAVGASLAEVEELRTLLRGAAQRDVSATSKGNGRT